MLLLVLLLSILGLSAPSEAAGLKLPDLWPAVSNETSSYHVRYHLEVKNNPEVLTLEEWASFDEQLFRLDLIGASGRVSYLSYGQTGEMFGYQPFTCSLVTGEADHLKVLANLFLGYPLVGPKSAINSTKQILVYGLGPLWLRARRDALQVDDRRADPLSPASLEQKHKLSVDFDKYLVEMPAINAGMEKKLRLLFLFPVGINHFVEVVDWLVGDELMDAELHGRARLIELDLRPIEASVFDLPVGYGCKRQAKYQPGFSVANLDLNLLYHLYPNQVSLAVSTSRPNSDLASSWSTTKFSVSLTRHSLELPIDRQVGKTADHDSYFVSLVQQRDEQTGKLRRTKRVWWLPTEKVDSNTQALVYEMDLSAASGAANACRVSHRNLHDQLVLSFPRTTNNTSTKEDSKQMVLSVDQILFLLEDNNNYHQITRLSGSQASAYNMRSSNFKDIYFEKRLNKFRLTYDGSAVWSGPVSIVKRINKFSGFVNQKTNKNTQYDSNDTTRRRPNNRLVLDDQYKTTLTLFFYSKDFETLQYKAVIELLGNHDVDYAYLHKQLDVSSCVPPDRQKSIVIKYPIEEPTFLNQLESKKEFIGNQLYKQLFFKTVFIPLQITKLAASFDYFNMHLRATILDLPLTHTFELKKGFKLMVNTQDQNSRAARNALDVSTSSSADGCGDRCEHYNCFRFSYEPNTKQCRIELVANKTKVTESASSDMYSFVKRSYSVYWRGPGLTPDLGRTSRPHLNARSMIEILEQTLIMDKSILKAEEIDSLNPLSVRLKVKSTSATSVYGAEKEITLRPASIESDYESMNEYVKQIESSQASANNNSTEVVKFEGQFQPLYYSLLMEDRAYSKGIGETMDGVASYEDCASYCEQNDCRSFSYCRQDEQCRVTSIHHEKFVDLYSEGRPLSAGCALYSLDYLSKFEPYGRVRTPARYRDTSDASSARDCANICMDQQSFTCEGFFHCEAPPRFDASAGAHRCYLIDWHVDYFMGPPEISFEPAEAAPNGSEGSKKEVCSFYSRFYMAHFDKFFAKKMDLSTSGQSSKRVVSGPGAEYCAKRCVQLGCLAFDACPGADGFGQTCQFASDSISRDHLRDEPRCTTFVMADKSQFNRNKVSLIRGLKPDAPAAVSSVEYDKEAPPAGQTAAGSPEMESEQRREAQLEKDDINADLMDKLSPAQRMDWAESSGGSGWGWLARLWRLVWSLGLGVCSGGLFVAACNEAYTRGWLDALAGRVGLGRS